MLTVCIIGMIIKYHHYSNVFGFKTRNLYAKFIWWYYVKRRRNDKLKTENFKF